MTRKLFDPNPLFQDLRPTSQDTNPTSGDRRDGLVYGYTKDLVLAVNVALATGRPLLLRGHPGSGKSSVAFNIARILDRCYFEAVVTSRTEARDLLWRFDAVRRLGDAYSQNRGSDDSGSVWHSLAPYIEPGPLWWIFDEASARVRGFSEPGPPPFEEAKSPARYRPFSDTPFGKAVLLIDEIDKAEPDVPNNLLVALGSMQFRIEEIGKDVEWKPWNTNASQIDAPDKPLVIITTNEERQLPSAFLRRCVVYRFPGEDDDRLVEIAEKSEGRNWPGASKFYRRIAETMRKLAQEENGPDAPVSIAEYLDAIRACKRLGAVKNEADITSIIDRVARKQPARD